MAMRLKIRNHALLKSSLPKPYQNVNKKLRIGGAFTGVLNGRISNGRTEKHTRIECFPSKARNLHLFLGDTSLR